MGLRPACCMVQTWVTVPLRQGGFTLLELVVVMVITGILAVAALPKMLDKAEVDRAAALEEVKAALQFARKTAIYSRRAVCVSLASNTLTLNRDPTPPVVPPVSPNCSQTLDLPVSTVACASHAVCPAGATTLSMVPASFYFQPSTGEASAAVLIGVAGHSLAVDAATGFVQ